MIHLVTSRPQCYHWDNLESSDIVPGNYDEFVHWINHHDNLQLDSETTMTKDSPDAHQDRKLLVLQLGSMDGEDQWLFEFTGLTDEWISLLKLVLGAEFKTFFLHNSKFDYIVLKNALGVSLCNVHDTMLMSQVLNTGLKLPKGYHSLNGCLERFLNIRIDKTEQTTFTEEPLTEEQIIYGAVDVMFLGELADHLAGLLREYELWYLYDTVERRVVTVYADMELTGMRFDDKHWLGVAAQLVADRDAILIDLNKEILADPKLVRSLKSDENALGEYLIQPTEEFKVNWNSSSQRKLLLSQLIPSMPNDLSTKPAVKAWFKDNIDKLTQDEIDCLNHFMSRSYNDINSILVSKHKQWLLDNGMFVPAGTILINWNSNQHKLLIFNHYYPNLTDTNAKSLNRITKNALINQFKKYTSAQKRVTSYGESFLEKYVRRDGMVAPYGCKQILNTGRISFGILLQIPADSKFRNAFLPPEDDWVFVDSDYASAEVVIMSYAAGEKAFLDAITQGKDLHSMSASLVFKDKWASLAEPGCVQMATGALCTCPEHLKLRKFSKSITFGLAYGLSYHGLAERLDISKEEAKELIEKFFEAFPSLKSFFEGSKKFSMENNFIRSMMPTGRIRFFHVPENQGEKDAIGREGMNFGIQETNATMLKIALIKLAERIKREKLQARIHLPVHDEILSSCHKDIADYMLQVQEECMIEAGEIFLGKGYLGVESKILTKWAK